MDTRTQRITRRVYKPECTNCRSPRRDPAGGKKENRCLNDKGGMKGGAHTRGKAEREKDEGGLGVLRPPFCSAFWAAVPHGLERLRVGEPAVFVDLDTKLADAARGDGYAVCLECSGLRAGAVGRYDARGRDNAVPRHGRGRVRDEVDGFFDTSGGLGHAEELGNVTTSYDPLCWDELDDTKDGKIEFFHVGPHVSGLFINDKNAEISVKRNYVEEARECGELDEMYTPGVIGEMATSSCLRRWLGSGRRQ